MPPRTAIIEDFDDDTDIPLPNVPLPNTGTHGPLLQEVDSDDDGGFDYNRGGGIPGLGSGFGGMGGPMPVPGPASPSQMQFQREKDPNAVTDVTPYKTWTCIYPIYIDAKRPYTTGERRIARAKSIWWPLSKDIADAASRLGLGTLHEVSKSHPRDWDNPGRVRVLWKKDGRLVNSSIKTKKELLEAICFQIQLLKPELVPKTPYTYPSSSLQLASTNPSSTSTAKPTPSSSSSKSKPASKNATSSKISKKKKAKKPSGRPLPQPPEPLSSLSVRLSPYSPAISTGMLIETVKAGMNAQEQAAAGGAGGPGQGTNTPMKGKRKVVRVRG